MKYPVTSAGAIIALLLALKIDLQIIEDYFIERPWNKFFLNLMT